MKEFRSEFHSVEVGVEGFNTDNGVIILRNNHKARTGRARISGRIFLDQMKLELKRAAKK